MKHLYIIATLLSIFSQTAFSQSDSTEKIWVTIDDITVLPTKENNELKSTEAEVQALIEQFNIVHVEQALPDSRREALKKVYEVHCNCDALDLLETIANTSTFLTNPETAPDYQLLATTNDYNAIFNQDYALDLIDAQGAWDFSTGDTNIILGISDGNFFLNHEDLQTEFVSAGTWASPLFYYHHGTAVAITAAGATNNGVGKSSIGYDCRLNLGGMNYNIVLQQSYAGARVINLSWMSGCWPNSYIQAIIDEVYDNGTIIVAAAGNGNASCGSSSNLVYPAACNNVIAVSSIGPTDNHEGVIGDPNSAHQHNSSVDICAPGYNVALSIDSGYYLTGNGTSFAAPYVTGTIGLMLSLNPCLTFEEVEQILYSTAENIDAQNPNYIGGLGSGRLNAKAALQAVSSNMISQQTTNVSCVGYSNGAIDLINTNPLNTYTWSTTNGSGIVTNSEDQTGLTAGTYYLTITDTSGCSISDSIVLVEPGVWVNSSTMSMFPGSENISCYGFSDGSIDLEVANGSTGYTYAWSSANGNGLNPTTEDQSNLSAGIYSVIVTDGNGCTHTETFELLEPTQLTETITSSVFPSGDNISCHGLADGTLDLTVTGGASNYLYAWTTSNGSGLNPTDEDQMGLSAGTYSVTVTDANGCLASETVVLTEPTYLSASITTVSDYYGLPISCTGMNDGAIDVQMNGGSPGYSCSWNTTPVQVGTSLSGIGEGNYTVTCIDANGCETTASVELLGHALPSVNPDPSVEVCQGEPVTFGSNSAPTESCFWKFSNGMQVDVCGSNTVFIDEPGCLDASLYVTNEFGCTDSVFLSDYICVHANPIAEFNMSSSNLTIIENSVSFENTSLNADSYYWEFSDGSSSYEDSPNHTFMVDEPGEYEVILFAENEFGCTDTALQTIRIWDELLFYIPNAFTPNGDEYNNAFRPVFGSGYNPKDYSLKVYNRWGELVFESLDLSFGWDGTYNGNMAQTGIYSWIMTLREDKEVLHNSKDVYSGSVSLLR